MTTQSISARPIPCSYQTTKPPPTAYDTMFRLIVHSVFVSETKDFYVYRGLLERSSSWFRDAFEHKWSTNHGFMPLEWTHERFFYSMEVFKLFFYWLNTGELSISTFATDNVWEFYAAAYEFSHVYQIYGFMNSVVEAFYFALIDEVVISPDAMTGIYKHTHKGSALRWVLADWIFEHDDMAIEEDARDQVPKALLWDIIALSYARGQGVGYLERVSKSEQDGHVKSTKKRFCDKYHSHPWDRLAIEAE
ncbi:hypothetical protein PTNB73_10018 [Pyrenophora teres f. teres]|nr:hypothetical protein HRS9139_09829 [Pyrenophora teres f. teres]KAE8823634.1 hypothetical protein PTNB85_10136 [Pyrenophora teres f. teres]KAE8854595.1 hypothetical protein PTNB29_09951 [Pyrenophora teres f. teres]KAE8855732.1 hypothetical protein PTNB73_10018 [Pyrenophora teres f. teres]